MDAKIFLQNEYRGIINLFLARNETIRGYKTLLAQAAGCSKSFLSQVLNSHVQLSPDQGILLSKFWSLSSLETDYFHTLICRERAGTKQLKEYLDQKLIRLHQQSSQVANHISYKVSLTSEQSSEYYGSWLYQAIHAAVAVPELKTIPKLAARFRCDKMRVSRVIQRLSEMGLVETDPKGKWRATHNHTHLDRDSPNFSHHHRNWRLRSCHDEVQNSPDSLLYSGTYALSEKAAATIKALLLESLKDAHDQVLASKEEKVYALAIDWYEV